MFGFTTSSSAAPGTSSAKRGQPNSSKQPHRPYAHTKSSASQLEHRRSLQAIQPASTASSTTINGPAKSPSPLIRKPSRSEGSASHGHQCMPTTNRSSSPNKANNRAGKSTSLNATRRIPSSREVPRSVAAVPSSSSRSPTAAPQQSSVRPLGQRIVSPAKSVSPPEVEDGIVQASTSPTALSLRQSPRKVTEAAGSYKGKGKLREHEVPASSSAISGSGKRRPSGPHFDSLQDLLERAGYKETRVITPNPKMMLAMADKHATDFEINPSPSPSEKQQSQQQSSSVWSWISSASPRTERSPPLSSSATDFVPASWFASLTAWKSPSTTPTLRCVSNPMDAVEYAQTAASEQRTAVPVAIAGPSRTLRRVKTSISDRPAQMKGGSSEAMNALPSIILTCASGSQQRSVSPSEQDREQLQAAGTNNQPVLRKTRSKNDLWTATLALRSVKSLPKLAITAEERAKSLPSRSVVTVGLGEMEVSSRFKGAGNKAKNRKSLREAFAEVEKTDHGPNEKKKANIDDVASPEDWRKSLLSLSREEAMTAADSSPQRLSKSDPIQAPSLLISAPAEPVLSSDAAVALRNGGCLRPMHLRKARSIEVLRAALSGKPSEHNRSPSLNKTAVSRSGSGSLSPSSSAGSIKAPVIVAPVLTISSPSGVRSPQALTLEGQDFEARSYPPVEEQPSISSVFAAAKQLPHKRSMQRQKLRASAKSALNDIVAQSNVRPPSRDTRGTHGDGAVAGLGISGDSSLPRAHPATQSVVSRIPVSVSSAEDPFNAPSSLASRAREPFGECQAKSPAMTGAHDGTENPAQLKMMGNPIIETPSTPPRRRCNSRSRQAAASALVDSPTQAVARGRSIKKARKPSTSPQKASARTIVT